MSLQYIGKIIISNSRYFWFKKSIAWIVSLNIQEFFSMVSSHTDIL